MILALSIYQESGTIISVIIQPICYWEAYPEPRLPRQRAPPGRFFAAGSEFARKPTSFGPTPPIAATALGQGLLRASKRP